MKSLMIAMMAAVLFVPSCQYRGAVYASHTHVGIGVRSSPEAASPIEMNVGYDHEVVAFVPKREGETMPGESAALISMSATQIMSKPGSGTVLKVRDGLITGSAAIAASVPDEAEITASVGGSKDVRTRATGTMGERIEAAFKPTPLYPTKDIKDLDELIRSVQVMSDADQRFTNAAARVGGEFDDLFRARRQEGLTGHASFLSAKNRYVQTDTENRTRAIVSALIAVGGN